MEVRDIHMKYRCIWISVMCGLSTYTWINYSLFEPIEISVYTPYVINGIIFLSYLTWDTYKMLTDSRLYRTDLMIHHGIAITVTVSCITTTPLHMSNYMIAELISLLNYPLRNYINLLNYYRTFIIITLRIPLTIWFLRYYSIYYNLPRLKLILSPNHYIWMEFITIFSNVFILYDLFILYKIYKPKKIKQ